MQEFSWLIVILGVLLTAGWATLGYLAGDYLFQNSPILRGRLRRERRRDTK